MNPDKQNFGVPREVRSTVKFMGVQAGKVVFVFGMLLIGIRFNTTFFPTSKWYLAIIWILSLVLFSLYCVKSFNGGKSNYNAVFLWMNKKRHKKKYYTFDDKK
ncbi:hypothetical protein [Streptococcus dentiloxodontae]